MSYAPDGYIEFRTAVLLNLQKVLETCKYNDKPLTGKVHLYELKFGTEQDDVFISIIEPPVDFSKFATKPYSTMVENELHVLVQGYMKGTDHDELFRNAMAFLADAKRVLYEARNKGRGEKTLDLGPSSIQTKNDEICGGSNVFDIQVGNGVIRPDEIVENNMNFWLEVSIKLIECPLKPFVKKE